jgi:GT2 family glycosyltransferase
LRIIGVAQTTLELAAVYTVDIIVPIFNASAEVRACLAALDSSGLPDGTTIWLMDDASSDPSIAKILRDFQRSCEFKTHTVRQPKNLGFVGNVNDALARSHRDVVLLNSDTLVTQGWLQAMMQSAARHPKAASITPFSNNAEICSFPMLCVNHPVPENLMALAQACEKNAPDEVELPTGVGFCMYMRRAAVDQIGNFDAATFGKGYGEENDWCVRAKAWGWTNLLCNRAYVAHVGGRSFASVSNVDSALQAKRGNGGRLLARYPHYDIEVQRFIAADPTKAVRATLQAVLNHISN